jgi:hypothetical protein
MRLIAAGLPVGWAAFDEVYTRSGKLREACEKAGLAYVGILPCDFGITLASGAVIRADEAVKDAVFERRSRGTGTKGTPPQRLGTGRRRQPTAFPADPPPDLPASPGRAAVGLDPGEVWALDSSAG